VRYQALRSVCDNHVFLLCLDSFFDLLPDEIRKQGPRQGMHRGEVAALFPLPATNLSMCLRPPFAQCLTDFGNLMATPLRGGRM
jgi:hypothetical protein